MKLNLTKLFPRLLILLLLSGCVGITEEIYLNEDGSGKYMVYSDMISTSRSMMMSMMSGMYPDASPDSLREIVDNKIWQQFPSEIDSVIDMSSRIPDSVKNDPANKKYLDRLEMFMKGSRKEGYLNSGMKFSFKNMDDLEKFQEFLEKTQNADQGQMPSTSVKYSLKNNTFSRKTMIEEDLDMNDSTMAAMGAMLAESKWKLIIHLPQKAKKVTTEQLVGKVGNDVVYEYDLLKLLLGEQSSDVTISF